MRYQICSRHIYIDSEKKTKIIYYKAGYIRLREDGTMFMRLYSHPSTSFQIFKSKEEMEETMNKA